MRSATTQRLLSSWRVDRRGLQRRVGVEAGLRVEQRLAAGVVERLASGAEHLPAEPRLVDDDRRVVERVLLDETVERPVDDRETRLVGGQLGDELSAQVRHGVLLAARC